MVDVSEGEGVVLALFWRSSGRAVMLRSSFQVPAEWHGWLHHSSDQIPKTKPIYAYTAGYDNTLKTGRDTSYKNPGHFLGGKAKGDGLFTKSGSARPPIQKWDPNAIAEDSSKY